ncbi:MAG: hypothetical protein Q4F13_06765 [Pseudomonadota bacterium]|nr:hypothetical protein [Pseudomonadota bacterium]
MTSGPKSDTQKLAESVATLGEAVGAIEGELPVLMCAVAALVQTHPDAAAFAGAFRRVWMRLGSPNQSLEDGDEAGDRMRQALEILQEHCRVDLNVLPPRT